MKSLEELNRRFSEQNFGAKQPTPQNQGQQPVFGQEPFNEQESAFGNGFPPVPVRPDYEPYAPARPIAPAPMPDPAWNPQEQKSVQQNPFSDSLAQQGNFAPVPQKTEPQRGYPPVFSPMEPMQPAQQPQHFQQPVQEQPAPQSQSYSWEQAALHDRYPSNAQEFGQTNQPVQPGYQTEEATENFSAQREPDFLAENWGRDIGHWLDDNNETSENETTASEDLFKPEKFVIDAKENKKTKKSFGSKLLGNIFFVISAIVVLFVFVVYQGGGGRSLFGYSYSRMEDVDMLDDYPIGSLVIYEKLNSTEGIIAGDCIAFIVDDGSISVRQVAEVIENYDNSGGRGFRTQGITGGIDGKVVYSNNVTGIAIGKIKEMGNFTNFISYLGKTPVFILFIFVPIILCLIIVQFLIRDVQNQRKSSRG